MQLLARDDQPRAEARPRSIIDAAMAPMIGDQPRVRWLLVVLAMPMLAAAGAFGLQVARGGLSVTGLTDQYFWGLYSADLVTFIGFSYGGALVSAILRLTNAEWRAPIVRLAEGTALVTLLIGAVFPIIHIGHPERVWQMFTRPQLESPLVWDMVAILTYLLATLLLFALPLIPDAAAAEDHPDLPRRKARALRLMSLGWRGTSEQRAALERALSVLAVAIIPIAVMVHTVLSYAFSLTSRPGWHSTIFGPYFVVGAIYSGVAVVIIAAVAYRTAYRLEEWIDDRALQSLAYLMVALGGLYGYLFFSEVTTEGYVGSLEAQTLLHDLLLDRYAPLTWTFVALGLVAPIVLVAWRRTRTTLGITTAAVLVAAMMGLKRFLIVVPPLARPLVGVEGSAEVAAYSPSWVEWTVTVGALAAVPFLLVLLFRFVPVMAIHDLEARPGGDAAAPARGDQVDADGSQRGHAAVLALVVMLVALLAPAVALAADAEDGGEPVPQVATTIAVEVAPPSKLGEGLPHRLSLRLTDVEGAPVTQVTVTAVGVYDLLGERQAVLGRGTTDATGTALVPVAPRLAEQRVIAVYDGDATHAPTTTETRVVFPPEALTPYDHEHGQHALLDPVRTNMPWLIAATVLLLWLGLTGLTVVTVRRIRAAPRSQPRPTTQPTREKAP